MQKKFDFIIVGQGIAGTMLAWFLEKHGKSFIIIDQFNPSSSSQVAAGIIHPITGRRIVKTWMADTLISSAENTYQEIADFFNTNFYHSLPVLELVDNAKEYNDWLARSESIDLRGYFSIERDYKWYPDFLKPVSHGGIVIHHSGWIDLKLFLQSFRNYFSEKNVLIDKIFDHIQLRLENDIVHYEGILAGKIIFCEGIGSMKNPFWKNLPFLPAKGEILTIRCEATIQHIITKKIFILPVEKKLFKVGSTYNWKDLSEAPTAEAKNFLLNQLKEIVKSPFEVIKHEASVRPSVKDRRPFIGLHPQFRNVGIFNGLGTKGCLLAPFFANHFAEFLIGKDKLMSEINVLKHFPVAES